jgi:hypothetical protein
MCSQKARRKIDATNEQLGTENELPNVAGITLQGMNPEENPGRMVYSHL